MSRVVALIPDLLFGSRVVGGLAAAGHEVQLVGDESRAQESLVSAGAEESATAADADDLLRGGVDVLVVDLTSDAFDGAATLESLSRAGTLREVRTLAFYAHVDVEVRKRAELAGFDLVVPRSRMAREGVALVERLAAGSA